MKLALALGVLFVSSGNSFASTTVPVDSTSNWVIYAWFDDSGAFGHCGMETGSKAGSERLMLIADENGYSLAVYSPDWNLTVGDSYDSTTIIGADKWGGHAVVVTSNGVMLKYGWDTGFGAAFRAGTRMDLEIGKFGRSLTLVDSESATIKLAACITKYMPSKNPFGPPATPTSNPFK